MKTKPQLDAVDIGMLEQKHYHEGFEQGKLAVLEKLIGMIEIAESDDGPGIVCYKQECFEDGICKHEILRLKSQLEKDVKE